MKNCPVKILFLIFSISLLNYIDRQILYAVFPLIKEELLLSDAKLGMLASSFMIVYMCFAPFVGFFGDRVKRPKIIGISVILWSVATAITGMAKNYIALLFSRALVGIGEAGYGSVSPSYLAEWFPKNMRARIMSLYALAIPVGSALGYLFGGYLGDEFGWRHVFFIAALPGLLLGTFSFFLKETPQKEESSKPLGISDYKVLVKNRTYLLICFAQAMATFTVGGLAAWMPTFFVRNYGISVSKAGFIFGVVTVLAGISGNIFGGFVGDYLKERTPRGYFVLAYLAFFTSVPFAIFAILSDNLAFAITMVFFAEFFAFAHSGPFHAAIIDVTGIKVRSMAFALDIFIIHAFGDAISPVLVGYASDIYGLRFALFACSLFLVFAAAFSILAGVSYNNSYAKWKK